MKRLFLSLLAASLLTACGTTSDMKSSMGANAEVSEDVKADFSAYNTVIVKDFTDGTEKSGIPQFAGKNFADQIAAAIKTEGVFETVSRQDIEAENALIVGGDIKRYKKGSSTMRLMVGFGAGSSYFDANVKITDAKTGVTLGEIEVDKNSNPLGGGIAMAQTVDNFMQGAAEKIAEEMAMAKTGETDGDDDKS